MKDKDVEDFGIAARRYKMLLAKRRRKEAAENAIYIRNNMFKEHEEVKK